MSMILMEKMYQVILHIYVLFLQVMIPKIKDGTCKIVKEYCILQNVISF